MWIDGCWRNLKYLKISKDYLKKWILCSFIFLHPSYVFHALIWVAWRTSRMLAEPRHWHDDRKSENEYWTTELWHSLTESPGMVDRVRGIRQACHKDRLQLELSNTQIIDWLDKRSQNAGQLHSFMSVSNFLPVHLHHRLKFSDSSRVEIWEETEKMWEDVHVPTLSPAPYVQYSWPRQRSLALLTWAFNFSGAGAESERPKGSGLKATATGGRKGQVTRLKPKQPHWNVCSTFWVGENPMPIYAKQRSSKIADI